MLQFAAIASISAGCQSELVTSVPTSSSSSLALPSNGLTVGTNQLAVSSGKVGVGTSAPAAQLDVAGAVKLGTDTSSCTTSLEGAIRYSSGVIEFCNGVTWAGIASGGGGGLTSVGLSLPAEFSVSGSPLTSNGSISASWASATANKVFASPDGLAGTPSFRALVAGDLPAPGGDIGGTYGNSTVSKLQTKTLNISGLATGNYLRYNGTDWVNASLVTGDVQTALGAASGTNSGYLASADWTAFNGAATATTAATSSGTVSTIVKRDASGNFAAGTITASGIVTSALQVTGGTPGAGKVLTSDASGNATWQAASAGGALTSVGLSLPAELSVSGSPLTSNGSISASWASAGANKVFAGPDGSAGTPAFRALASGDIPAPGGDIGGTYASATVSKLQTKTLNISGLATGNYLRYNGTDWVNASLVAGDVQTALGTASGTTNGYLTSTDWTTFNGAATATTAATSSNTVSTIVKRDGSGNFSAGTVTASGVVTGTLQVTGGTPGAGKVLTSDASGNATWQAASGGVSGSGTSGFLAKFTAAGAIGDSVLKETSSKIGIGLSGTPQTELEISSSGTPGGVLTLSSASTNVITGDSIGGIEFYSNDNSVNGTGVGARIKAVAEDNGVAYGLNFSVRDGSANTSNVRINSTGYVGIGTQSPNEALEVNGSVRIGSETTRTNTTYRGQLALSSTYITTANANTTINWARGNIQELNTFLCDGTKIITFSNLKDGAAYTLLLSGDAAHSGVCNFSSAGYTFKASGGNTAPTASKDVLFTFVVINTTVVYNMIDNLQ